MSLERTNGQVPPISHENYVMNQARIAEAQAVVDQARTYNAIGYATFEAQERELRQKVEAGERARAQLEFMQRQCEEGERAREQLQQLLSGRHMLALTGGQSPSGAPPVPSSSARIEEIPTNSVQVHGWAQSNSNTPPPPPQQHQRQPIKFHPSYNSYYRSRDISQSHQQPPQNNPHPSHPNPPSVPQTLPQTYARPPSEPQSRPQPTTSILDKPPTAPILGSSEQVPTGQYRPHFYGNGAIHNQQQPYPAAAIPNTIAAIPISNHVSQRASGNPNAQDASSTLAPSQAPMPQNLSGGSNPDPLADRVEELIAAHKRGWVEPSVKRATALPSAALPGSSASTLQLSGGRSPSPPHPDPAVEKLIAAHRRGWVEPPVKRATVPPSAALPGSSASTPAQSLREWRDRMVTAPQTI
ncbi:hypothetical protein PM082_005844 [Marasmius tenuissimus]|nr:hypothetical protein PM082_005844 [Marasmius tenuissimus]